MCGFMQTLKIQRWDDHRYYHHSLINQSLHLLSATSVILMYFLLFWDPAIAAMTGWMLSMTSRQIGHFFFEPKSYDAVNGVTHQYKEEVKVGYNLRRKIVLLSIWALSPLPLYFKPTFFGMICPWEKRTRVCPSDRHVLAVYRSRRSNSAIHSAVLYQRLADWIGMGGENHHRPIPRHQTLLQGALLSVARRYGRPGGAEPRPPRRRRRRRRLV